MPVGRTIVSEAVAPLLRPTAAGFRQLARLRGARALHPHGLVLTGRLHVDGLPATGGPPAGAPFLDEPATYDVRARLSKAAGTPGALPDALGLGLRLTGGTITGSADLLLTTTSPALLLRHLPLVVTGWRATYGTLVPYRTPTGWWLLAVRGPQHPVPASLAALGAAAGDELIFELLAGHPRGDRWPVGALHLAAPATGPGGEGAADDADLRLDPAHTPPGLALPGRFGRWREAAYRGSHAGWPAG